MKKLLKQIYLLLISALLFGCLLAIQKDFDLLSVLSTEVGLIILCALFGGTLTLMLPSNKKAKKETTPTSEILKFNHFDIDKKLIENHLLELTKDQGEDLAVSYKVEEKTLFITIRLIKIENIKVNEVIEELKEKIGTSLQEKFGLKEELDLKFNVE